MKKKIFFLLFITPNFVSAMPFDYPRYQGVVLIEKKDALIISKNGEKVHVLKKNALKGQPMKKGSEVIFIDPSDGFIPIDLSANQANSIEP